MKNIFYVCTKCNGGEAKALASEAVLQPASTSISCKALGAQGDFVALSEQAGACKTNVNTKLENN